MIIVVSETVLKYPNKSMNRPDSELDAKGRLSIRFLNETLQNSANEPSLALYRIQVKNPIDPFLIISDSRSGTFASDCTFYGSKTI